ncbi:MAG: hypothetical protein AAFU57_04395 [Bacteroidota bacterium]
MKRPTFCTFLFFLFLCAGCSTYLTSSENVSKTKSSYEKILVVGRSKDRTARIKFENSVVDQLKERGVQGIASHTAKSAININQQYSESQLATLKKNLMSKGYDGAIVTNLIDTEQYTDVIPGNTSTTYIPARAGRFGRYLTYYPVTTWEPDELKSGTKYIFESSLYRLDKGTGDNLQWVGGFEVKDPSSLEKTVALYAKDLINALVKSSITQE